MSAGARIGRIAAGVLALLAAAPGAYACKFQVKSTPALAFGELDPSNSIARAAIMPPNTLQVGGDCNKVTLTFSADNGTHPNGGTRRMSNGKGYIPYVLSLPPPYTGTGVWVSPSIRAFILANTYADAFGGSYSDRLVLTVTP